MSAFRAPSVKVPILLAWVCALSACAAPERVVPTQRPTIARATGTQHLYVLNDGGPEGLNSIAIYALGASKPSRVIKKGIYDPKALAVDALGNINVANYFTSDVTTYLPVGRSPAHYITGFSFPSGLAMDASGDLAVMWDDQIGVYGPSGSLERTVQLDNGFNYTPTAIGYDSNDNLWVKSLVANENELDEYRPGSSTPALTITGDVGYPPLAFDSSGNVYSETPTYGIAIYAPPSTTPTRIIPHNSEVLCIAADQSGHLFVASPHSITAYSTGSGAIAYSIETGIHRPTSMAFDATGRLYVANLNSTVSVYAPGSGALLQTLQRGIQKPSGIAIGP